jgi:hypothetical protein
MSIVAPSILRIDKTRNTGNAPSASRYPPSQSDAVQITSSSLPTRTACIMWLCAAIFSELLALLVPCGLKMRNWTQ